MLARGKGTGLRTRNWREWEKEWGVCGEGKHLENTLRMCLIHGWGRAAPGLSTSDGVFQGGELGGCSSRWEARAEVSRYDRRTERQT